MHRLKGTGRPLQAELTDSQLTGGLRSISLHVLSFYTRMGRSMSKGCRWLQRYRWHTELSVEYSKGLIAPRKL